MILEWTDLAASDLIEILDYIAEDNPAAALAAVDRIEQTSLRLADFPLSGREGSLQSTRELPIPSLPFVIIYSIRETTVEILRVLHGAQRWPPP
jgi:toxin ParE1/3/4